MTCRLPPRPAVIAGVAFLLFTALRPGVVFGQEAMCDPAYQDCRASLLGYIQNERVSIDVAMWFMEDQDLATAIIARKNAGVSVRILVDPRRNAETPMNAVTLDRFAQAGIPMRYKSAGGIMHWKFMLFNGQNMLQFSAANYSDFYFRPIVPYRNYTDEGIYFTDDAAVVNSFRRKFDDSWVDTSVFTNYANIANPPARAHALYPSIRLSASCRQKILPRDRSRSTTARRSGSTRSCTRSRNPSMRMASSAQCVAGFPFD